MKELTIEQKAQRYDEVLEKARQLCAYPTTKPFISDLQDFFPEFKESEDERIKKQIIYAIKELHVCDKTKRKCLAWLEKQGEQKHADDKIKPKFQNGQWIVWQNKYYKVNYNGCGYELVDQNGLSTSLEYGTIEENAHLWTIKDAKPGDILFHSDSASNGIFIFKELLKYEFSEKVICYCDYDSEDHFCLGEHHTCC